MLNNLFFNLNYILLNSNNFFYIYKFNSIRLKKQIYK